MIVFSCNFGRIPRKWSTDGVKTSVLEYSFCKVVGNYSKRKDSTTTKNVLCQFSKSLNMAIFRTMWIDEYSKHSKIFMSMKMPRYREWAFEVVLDSSFDNSIRSLFRCTAYLASCVSKLYVHMTIFLNFFLEIRKTRSWIIQWNIKNICIKEHNIWSKY